MGKVIVAGSINMDVIARVGQLPQTGETLMGKSVEYLPGGKGLNQAVAAAKMGAETILAGWLGDDAFAETLYEFIRRHDINTGYLFQSAKPSGTAFITVADDGKNTIVVVPGSNADVSAEDMSALEIVSGDVVVSQFEIPLSAIVSLFKKAKQKGAKTILNPSPVQTVPEELLKLTDVLIVNETELGFLNEKNIPEEAPVAEIIAACRRIRENRNQTIIVTLGSRGVVVVEEEAAVIESYKVEAIDTVGAGDCFAGVVAARLLNGDNLCDCARLGNKAASVCVTRRGAAPSMPYAHELM